MNSDNQEVIYCEDDGEYRIYFKVCKKHCIEQFYNNHLKPGFHITKFHRRQRLNNTNTTKLTLLFPLK